MYIHTRIYVYTYTYIYIYIHIYIYIQITDSSSSVVLSAHLYDLHVDIPDLLIYLVWSTGSSSISVVLLLCVFHCLDCKVHGVG